MVTEQQILEALSPDEWVPITSMIFSLGLKDMMQARELQIKLKQLERKGLVEVDIRKSKKHWKLRKAI